MEKSAAQNSLTRYKTPRFLSELTQLIRAFRLIDAAVFTGISIAGVFIAYYHLSVSSFVYGELLLFIISIYMLNIHIFLINDWADYKEDKKDHDKNKHCFHFSANTILFLSLFFGIVALVLLLSFSITKFLLGLIVILLSILYSSSFFYLRGKTIPVLSSALHLLGGMFVFLLGYSFYGSIQVDSVLTGLALGVFLMAGHLFQEIQDAKGDCLNKTKTTANTIGKTKTGLVATLLILIGHAFFQYLIESGMFPNITILNWLAFTMIISFIIIPFRSNFSQQTTKQLRNRYRVVYFIFGFFVFLKIVNEMI
jgi:4-hydroxybenzoate polyprenyltransferase